MKRKVATAAAAAAISMTALLFSGCDAFLLALFDDLAQRPTNVEASIGEHTDRIEVTWDGVNTEDKDYSVENYVVERDKWDGVWNSEGEVKTTKSTSYTDYVSKGVAYQYRVKARFTNEDESIYSDTAEGYAMDATSLKVYSASKADDGKESDAADSWVEFLAQKGWTYTITTDAAVDVFVKGNISDEPVETTLIAEGHSFKADESEIHHIKVGTDGTTISVSY